MKISHVNNTLLGLIILVNVYIIVAPVLPGLVFYFENKGDRRQQLQTRIHAKPDTPQVASQQNHVVIPSMLLDQPIFEGPVSQTYKVLDKGIWRWPHGSTPDKASNTVLIGHRFTYTNPQGIFYYLNKVKIGDEIGLFWNHKTYTYRVSKIKVVPPNDTNIEDATPKPVLTLFTCTPLWLPKDRLVVVADLETNQ